MTPRPEPASRIFGGQLAERRAEVQAPRGGLKRAVEMAPDEQHESATAAQAEGVGLGVARRLLRVVRGSRAAPSVPAPGRATRDAGNRAGPSLEVLDEASRPAVEQATDAGIPPAAYPP